MSRIVTNRNESFGDFCSECIVSKIHGLSLQQGIDLPHEFICKSDCNGRDHVYSFNGDPKGFFGGILNNSNEVTINVPPLSRGESIIDLRELSEDSVIPKRGRQLSNKKMRKGERKVLVILVQDRYGNAPHQSEETMARDIFGIDTPLSINLVSVFFL